MGWGTTSRRKTEAHEKSMGSYERHAWSDALAMASYLDEEIGADKARKIYEDVREVDLRKYEEDTGALIQDFIKRSESQRPSVLKKLPDERTRVVFQVLAILGCAGEGGHRPAGSVPACFGARRWLQGDDCVVVWSLRANALDLHVRLAVRGVRRTGHR